MMEFSWGEVSWREELTIPNEMIRDGNLILTDEPGLGLELNMDILREYRVSALDGNVDV